MPKSLKLAFSKLFNIGSWNVRGRMLKLKVIQVVLARTKLTSAELWNQKQNPLRKIKTAPSTVFSWEEKETNNGMGLLVNESLKVTSTNLVNERIVTFTVTKREKKTNLELNHHPL